MSVGKFKDNPKVKSIYYIWLGYSIENDIKFNHSSLIVN